MAKKGVYLSEEVGFHPAIKPVKKSGKATATKKPAVKNTNKKK